MTTTNEPSQTPAPNSGKRAPGCWPCLSYRDAGAALDYLASVLGFEKVCSYPGEQGREVAHAEMSWPGGGGIMFGSPRPVGDPHRIEPGSGITYLSSENVPDIYRRVRDAGWSVTQELTETDYGSTDIGFCDPEGNRWNVGTFQGEGY